MEWLALTLGVCFVSALVPVVNAELYLVGLVTQQPDLQWWLVGIAAGVGQMGGKLLYYYAGRGSLKLPGWLRRKTEKPPGRWAARLARFRDTCHERPVWAAGVLLLSASTGFPPFLAIAVIAGVVRIPVGTFLVTGVVGRTARFAAIAAFPGLADYVL